MSEKFKRIRTITYTQLENSTALEKKFQIRTLYTAAYRESRTAAVYNENIEKWRTDQH